jgi:mRNA interferase YafQ
MLEIIVKRSFEKDWKRLEKRGYDYSKMSDIVSLLASDQKLPERCRPHKLSGIYEGLWDCHIASDWILIYIPGEDSLTLVATGSHSDLF